MKFIEYYNYLIGMLMALALVLPGCIIITICRWRKSRAGNKNIYMNVERSGGFDNNSKADYFWSAAWINSSANIGYDFGGDGILGGGDGEFGGDYGGCDGGDGGCGGCDGGGFGGGD